MMKARIITIFKKNFLKILFLLLCVLAFSYKKDLDVFFQKPPVTVIFSETEGKLFHVAVEKGQTISKGQLLFLMNDDPCQAVLEKSNKKKQEVQRKFDAIYNEYLARKEELCHAEAQFADYENEYQKSQESFQKGILSKDAFEIIHYERENFAKEIEILRHMLVIEEGHFGGVKEISEVPDYQKAEKDKKEALVCLKNTHILAPFSGKIQSLSVAPADDISFGQALCAIEQDK